MSLLTSLAWLAAGGVGGAVGAALLLDGDSEATSTVSSESLVETVTGFALGRSDGNARAEIIGVAERVDAYRAAQQESDPAALSRALGRAAGRAGSAERDLEIDALLGRLSEIAPAYAAELTVALQLDAGFVAQAYLAWAAVDGDAALAGLSQIGSPATRRDVALVLTDVIGDDARGIARIAAALGPADGDALRIAWLADRAAVDPFGAIRDALALNAPALTRRALEQIAVAWTSEDPYGALAQADSLPADLAQAFRARVFDQWARIDAEGYVSYLESQTSLPQEAVAGVSYLLATNPELVERAAQNFTDTLGMSARAAVLQARALRDPDGAKAEAEALPPGQQRDMALQAVASGLAQTDPEAALAWVRGLSPPAPSAMQGVILSLAQKDIGLALELSSDPAFGNQSQLLLSVATSMGVMDPAQAPAVAERLLARDDLQSQAALRSLVGNWMQRDPETALNWVLEHGTEVDGTVLAGAAQTLAARDPVAAAEYLDRIPQAQRGAWVTSVATQYGRYDPRGAMGWVQQFQGQDYYDVALRQVITSSAQSDPLEASQMLSTASPTVQLGAAQQVASALAQQDPRTAAIWAASLSEPRARASAISAATTAWYAADRRAARSWALARPAGSDRDDVLANLTFRAAATGEFDRELMSSFSSAARAQQTAANAITILANNNPAQAHALLQSEITDPGERARIEAQIAQQRAQALPSIAITR